MAAPKPTFYVGEEIEPDDPSKPVLVWSGKQFVPKDKYEQGAGGADQRNFDEAREFVSMIGKADKLTHEPFATGFVGDKLADDGGGRWRGVQGTNAYALGKALEPIRARIQLSNLQNLKASSPVGASGLGGASDAEGRVLRSTEGSLDVGNSAADLRANLARVKRAQARRVKGLDASNAYDLAADDGGAIPQGALFRGPDGKTYTNTRGAGVPWAPKPQPAPASSGWSIQRVK
jgi:hypothetical protein